MMTEARHSHAILKRISTSGKLSQCSDSRERDQVPVTRCILTTSQNFCAPLPRNFKIPQFISTCTVLSVVMKVIL
jgi:hypothetical protein